jgi:predicted histidine transporter YuiF (NhaC family)
MYISWQTIITAGAVLAAISAILGLVFKIHKWYLAQNEQTKKIEELKEKHTEDVQHIKKENMLICYALSACLDGLQQLGCNHTVPDAKAKLDKHLNQSAHE